MHDWSEENFDWAGINDAAEYLYNYLKRWRLPVSDAKEKFGTVRLYCSLHWERGWLLMHLFYPGYRYYRFPDWVRKLDFRIPADWLNVVLYPFYCWLYARAYRNAVRKWPHLKCEILHSADYSELLIGIKCNCNRKETNSEDDSH